MAVSLNDRAMQKEDIGDKERMGIWEVACHTSATPKGYGCGKCMGSLRGVLL